MAQVFFTSDCHFGHKNLLRYEPISRDFSNIDDHNKTIVEHWNSIVSEEDTVYVIGDFFMGPIEQIDSILPKLTAKRIVLIRGNHDTNPRVKRMKEIEPERLEVIENLYHIISLDGYTLYLCHYPCPLEELDSGHDLPSKLHVREQWAEGLKKFEEDSSENKLWLYGHVHSKAPVGEIVNNSFHVGMDTNYLYPITLGNIVD